MPASALTNRNYLIYLASNTISLHGVWIYRVALAWYAWQLSGSELWVGIIAFTQFAPAVVFAPVFGVLADRFDRRAASLLINALSVINMVMLGWLVSRGQMDISVLTLLSLMQGTLDGAHTPIRMTIVPNLVAREQLQSAIAFTSISFNVSRFVGPALAGVIISVYDVAAAFIINGITYIAMVAAMIVIQLNPSVDPVQRPQHVFQELWEGVHYVRGHATIRSLLLIVAVASLFGRGALEMLPAFADAVFHGGSDALATLTAAIGAGAIMAGIALSRNVLWLNVRVIRAAVIAAGLLIAVLGTVQSFWVATGVVTALGVVLSLCGVGAQILIQTLVDDSVRGRVSSIWGMVAFGGTALGGLIIGLLASTWDLQNAVLISGLLCATFAVVAVDNVK